MTQTLEIVRATAATYPAAQTKCQFRDARRIAFHLDLVAKNVPPAGRIMDLGGGLGMFTPALRRMGYNPVLVDDFRDSVNHEHPIEKLGTHAGVEVLSLDLTTSDFDPAPSSFDAITSFDSLEHWHGSPRPTLLKAMKALRPGGYFLLAVPNCVDLKKRIMTPLGRGAWSSWEEWYGTPVFRGHVREFEVADLRHIAGDLDLREARYFGRSWTTSEIIDRTLSLFPSLSSTIYLSGRKAP